MLTRYFLGNYSKFEIALLSKHFTKKHLQYLFDIYSWVAGLTSPRIFSPNLAILTLYLNSVLFSFNLSSELSKYDCILRYSYLTFTIFECFCCLLFKLLKANNWTFFFTSVLNVFVALFFYIFK